MSNTIGIVECVCIVEQIRIVELVGIVERIEIVERTGVVERIGIVERDCVYVRNVQFLYYYFLISPLAFPRRNEFGYDYEKQYHFELCILCIFNILEQYLDCGTLCSEILCTSANLSDMAKVTRLLTADGAKVITRLLCIHILKSP